MICPNARRLWARLHRCTQSSEPGCRDPCCPPSQAGKCSRWAARILCLKPWEIREETWVALLETKLFCRSGMCWNPASPLPSPNPSLLPTKKKKKRGDNICKDCCNSCLQIDYLQACPPFLLSATVWGLRPQTKTLSPSQLPISHTSKFQSQLLNFFI